ncbi:MAG: DUF1570 domain-containing protein [Planctomycetes bacterium]|nr:DUF1570 domain-containing protein [Planctomycetota bacterium]
MARASRAEPVRGEVYDTLIHEATHQFAFNMGLHSRIGQNPKWVVEGLATVLEVAGPARTKLSRSVRGRINRERFLWFRNYARTRRPDRSLAQFLRNDRMFDTAVLDAYSQAWALSFYLMETRPRRYMDYLKAVARRNPLRSYTPEERVRDFQKAFGENLDRLEADFLRFVDRL